MLPRSLFLAAIALFLTSRACAADYIIGADLSFLRQAETDGTVFKDNNQPKPALQIFRDHGYNWIRLRLFNDPAAVRTGRPLPNDLPYTLALAQDAKHLGYKFLLDFHYSDTWADPGKQFLPAAWQNKSHADLVTALHDYTRDTLLAFQKAGVMPDMVQIGNEITNGMLWPDGKLSGQGSTPGAWDRFTDLVKAGIAGVHDAVPDHSPRLMIQIDRGADKAGTKYFFDKLLAAGVNFDVIGQSYYPWYHGTLLDLRENLAFMAQTYKKEIVVVECAYNWRPTEYRNSPAPFPESPEGQKEFLQAVNQLVMNTPDNRGIGLFWWEAAVSPRTGLVSRSMFDTDANALPVLTTFDEWTRGKTPHPPRPTTRPRTTAPAQ
jgi:arabinogalactan endo-1,4-beta-galactosidase